MTRKPFHVRRALLAPLVLAAGLLGCVPDVDDDDSLVAAPRVLAISVTPAEAKPREKVKLSVLYADSDGEISSAPLDWALCADRKSLAELGPLNRNCLKLEGDTVLPLGEGNSASATMPADACRLFGPEPAPSKEGEPAGRPADPDPTGGFYQPGRIYDPETKSFSIFETRVTCNLAGVTQPVFADFNRRYKPNANPTVDTLSVLRGAAKGEVPAAGSGAPTTVEPGARVQLRVSWPECNADDAACGGAEHYVHFDPEARVIAPRRETMRLSWFATAGEFAEARTGRAEAEAEADAPTSDNTWIAPSTPGEVQLWVVLRDSRGGTSWKRYTFLVEP